MVKKRKRSKKWISWLVFLVLLITAGVVVYFVWDAYFNNEKKDTEQQIAEIEGQEEIEGKRKEEAELASEEMEKEKIIQYEGEDPNKADELTGVVTYAGVNGGNLMIRVNIDQYLNTGECELILKRGGAIIYSSIASIIGGASTATCEGFDVPVAELGGGIVEININLSADNRTGVIHGEVNI